MSELNLLISYLKGESKAEEIKHIKKERLAELLCSCFANEDWKLRKKAATLLYRFSKKEIFKALSQNINLNNDDYAFWSIKLATYLPKEASLKIITEYLKSKNKNIRIFSLDALERVRSRESIIILIKSLADSKWSVRKKAADILITYPQSIPLLIKNFKNSTEDQSYWIIRIVGQLIPEKNLDVLIKFLSSKNHKHKYFAIMALGTRQPIKAIPALLKCLRDRSWVIRKQSAEVLERYDKKALPYLKKVLIKSKSPDIRFWTSQLIAKIGGEDAIDFFDKLYSDSSSDVDMRNYIILSLASIKSEKIFTLLIKAFDDNYWLIRKQAFETAVQLGNKAVAPLVLNLEKALRSDEENICHWSLKVLLKIKGVALEPIKRFMKGNNKQIKNLIMMLFYEFSDPATFDILNDSLENDEWGIRNMAAKTLTKIGGPILKKLASYITRQNIPIASDRCYWTKKILLDCGEDGQKVYDNLIMQFNVNDLMELSGEVGYEENLNIEISREEIPEQFDAPEIMKEETEEEKALRKKVQNIFSDLTSEFEEIKAIALKTILEIDDLPQNIIDEVHKKLKILTIFGEVEYREIYNMTFEKFQHKFGTSDFSMKSDELKSMKWDQLITKWDKLYYIMLIYHFHPEKYKKEILEIAQKENDPLIINGLLNVFKFYNDSLVSEKIVQLMKKNVSDSIKEHMVYTLGQIDVPRSVVVLIPLLSSKYKYIAIKSLISLGEQNIEKAINDLTYLNNPKEWELALKLMEEVFLPSNTAVIFKGLQSSDDRLVEKTSDLFLSYLSDDIISEFKLNVTNMKNKYKEKIEKVIESFKKGEIKESRPRDLHEWQEFVTLLEQKKSHEEVEIGLENTLTPSDEKNIEVSEEDILDELEKGKPVDDYEDEDLLNIIAENALDFYKKEKFKYMPLDEDFKELIKVDDSIERRKDYIFKLQGDGLEDGKGNFIERLQAKMNRKSEIADTEKLLVHLIQKRLEIEDKIAKKLVKNVDEIKDIPPRIKQLIVKFKEIS